MNTRVYSDLFSSLLHSLCAASLQGLCRETAQVTYVDRIAAWCRENGLDEPDSDRPFRLIVDGRGGCRMLVAQEISEQVIDSRVKAAAIRDQVTNVAQQRSDRLSSVKEKLLFLFLNEFAHKMPGIPDDLLADSWAFEEMQRLGYIDNGS